MANLLLTIPRVRTPSRAGCCWFWSLLCRGECSILDFLLFYQSVVQDETKLHPFVDQLRIRAVRHRPLSSRRVFVPDACRSGKLFGWLRGHILRDDRYLKKNWLFLIFESSCQIRFIGTYFSDLVSCCQVVSAISQQVVQYSSKTHCNQFSNFPLLRPRHSHSLESEWSFFHLISRRSQFKGIWSFNN